MCVEVSEDIQRILLFARCIRVGKKGVRMHTVVDCCTIHAVHLSMTLPIHIYFHCPNIPTNTRIQIHFKHSQSHLSFSSKLSIHDSMPNRSNVSLSHFIPWNSAFSFTIFINSRTFSACTSLFPQFPLHVQYKSRSLRWICWHFLQLRSCVAYPYTICPHISISAISIPSMSYGLSHSRQRHGRIFAYPSFPPNFNHRFLQLRIAADVQIPREIAVRTHYRGNHERMERVGKLRLPREFLHLEVAKQLPPNYDRFLLHHAVQTQHFTQEFHEFKDRVC